MKFTLLQTLFPSIRLLQTLSPTIRHIDATRIADWRQVAPFAGNFVVTKSPQKNKAFNPDGTSPYGISFIAPTPERQHRLLRDYVAFRAHRLVAPAVQDLNTLLTRDAELPSEGLEMRLASILEMALVLKLLQAPAAHFENLPTPAVLAQLNAMLTEPAVVQQSPQALGMGK